MQLVDPDRGHGRAAALARCRDADLPVVATRVLLQATDPGQHVPGQGGRYRADLQIELLAPVLPVLVRRADQAEEAGPEDQGRHHGGDRQGRPGQRAAHRHGRAPVTGLHRHPHPEAARHRTGQPEGWGQPGGTAQRLRLGHAEGAPGVGGGAHRPGRHQHERRYGDDDQPGAEDGQVDVDARAGLRGPGRADRHQRGGGDGHAHRDDGAGCGHQQHPGQRQHGQLDPAHAERPQNREFRRVQHQLAVQQLRDHGQGDETGQRGEDGQGDRLRADLPLGRGVGGGQMDDLDAADPVPGGQRSGLAGEGGRVSPGPEHDVAAAAGRVERLGQPAAGERRAQQHARRAQLPGGGHDLVVGDHDGRHPEGQPHRMADALGTAALRVAEQVQRPTRLDVRPLGQALADHDCVLVSRVGQVPSQHLDPVDGPALAACRAGLRHQAGERRSARAGQRHLQEGHRIGRCHLRQGGHRPEVAVKPGLRRAHQQVRRAAAAQETGISGVGAPCAGRRGQHHPADQADEQHQAQHRAPALPQVGAQGEPGRCHGKIQLHQATWRQGW